MKSKSKDDNMAYCNKHERDYPMTLGCPQCKEELEQNHYTLVPLRMLLSCLV